MKATTHAGSHGPVHGIELDARDLEPWRPVITQVREAMLNRMVVGSDLISDQISPKLRDLIPSQDRVEVIATGCYEAARAGRLIDFGDWTNEVIKHGGNRGGPLYQRGAIGHPFRQPYVFFHTWEGNSVAYLVNPLEPGNLAGGDCEAIELQPLAFGPERALMIADAMMLEPMQNVGIVEWSKYHCSAIPSVWRFLPGAEAGNNGMAPANAAAGNVLDPLMTALLILSTRGIDRKTVTVSDKLQNARRKNGKPPIPPYDVVNSAPYVTAIQARRARGRQEPKGGHHASPVPHLRMGHPRTYASGVQIFVRDALINMSAEAKAAFLGNRSHYTIQR